MRLFRRCSFLILLPLLTAVLCGCDTIDNLPSILLNKTPVLSTPGSTSTPTSQAIIDKTSLPSATPDPSQVLTIWLPPDLNPNSNSTVGNLVAQRLDTFQKQNSGIKLHVRIKNLSGPQGMLETLAITHQAAPLAMPSIIILPQSDLEQAVRQNLVYPLSALSGLNNTADWYPYCQAMAQVDQKWYGVPFSGDALMLVYHTDNTKMTINTWDDIIKNNLTVLFPASDANALTTLALYQSLSGEINPGVSNPSFQESDLNRVFSFYQHAVHMGTLQFSLSQFENFDQTWNAYRNHQGRLVVTWASTYLKDPQVDDLPLPFPGLNGTPYTLATGNMVALSEMNPERQIISLKLIDFLIDPTFLSELNKATGNLPTRQSANVYPADTQKQALFDQIGKTAHLQPVQPDYLPISSRLKEATLQVLRLQISPQDAVNLVQNVVQKTP